jgi:hypothetical protein
MRQPELGRIGRADSTIGDTTPLTRLHAALPQKSDETPPATVARNTPRPIRTALSVGAGRDASWVSSRTLYMCAMPPNSAPRSSPTCAFVSTHTRYLAGADSIRVIAAAAVIAQPFFE